MHVKGACSLQKASPKAVSWARSPGHAAPSGLCLLFLRRRPGPSIGEAPASRTQCWAQQRPAGRPASLLQCMMGQHPRPAFWGPPGLAPATRQGLPPQAKELTRVRRPPTGRGLRSRAKVSAGTGLAPCGRLCGSFRSSVENRHETETPTRTRKGALSSPGVAFLAGLRAATEGGPKRGLVERVAAWRSAEQPPPGAPSPQERSRCGFRHVCLRSKILIPLNSQLTCFELKQKNQRSKSARRQQARGGRTKPEAGRPGESRGGPSQGRAALGGDKLQRGRSSSEAPPKMPWRSVDAEKAPSRPSDGQRAIRGGGLPSRPFPSCSGAPPQGEERCLPSGGPAQSLGLSQSGLLRPHSPHSPRSRASPVTHPGRWCPGHAAWPEQPAAEVGRKPAA